MVVNERLIAGFFTSIVLLFTCNSLIASAQVTQTRAADISKKYVWKSIYLTYGNICDVTQLLSKPEQLRKISLQPGGAVAPVLKDFLARHKADNQRDGLALLQIN